MDMTNGPDFIVMGARKSATTWLYYFADKIPGMQMPGVKEMNVFIQGGLWNDEVSETLDGLVTWWTNWYPESDVQAVCPPTNPDMTLDDAFQNAERSRIDRIAAEFADTQIIYVLRDPVERLWSDFTMEFVTNKGLELDATPEPDVLDLIVGRSIRGGLYSEVVRTWRNAFGSRFHVMFFDDLRRSPERFGQSFCSIVGATYQAGHAETTENPNPGDNLACPEFVRAELTQLLEPDLRILADEFGPSPIDRWLSP